MRTSAQIFAETYSKLVSATSGVSLRGGAQAATEIFKLMNELESAIIADERKLEQLERERTFV